MSDLQTLKAELLRIQQAMVECISEEGYILNHCKYKYKELVGIATDLKRTIDWMDALK